ncbi:MAG: O-acetyl-ADP-ribose deacetylase [Verrucomicrobiota bacterium]|nr:O-acetyl-ADP-ribose deacetylase [Limisphaera sp.]MDW8382672.1 O-acetyl-ADP-ribose deacetylase [Verrucomicrobiota bacterium]
MVQNLSQVVARLELVQGDITQQEVDAIVNAANETLLGGGGVDGAIHRAAGPQLLEECRLLGGCPTGQAKITRGYRLPARYVIHAVGPIWQGGQQEEDERLASCYRHALRLAVQHGCQTVAFPAISTGAYRFPMDRAARIALREILGFLASEPTLKKVRVVFLTPEALKTYREVLETLTAQGLD